MGSPWAVQDQIYLHIESSGLMTGSPKLVGPDPVQLHMDIWHAVEQLPETRLFGSAEADYPQASSIRTRSPCQLTDSAPTIVDLGVRHQFAIIQLSKGRFFQCQHCHMKTAELIFELLI